MRNEFGDSLCLPLKTGSQFAAVTYVIRHRRLLAIAFLFVVALGIRLYHLDEPPLSFHATRQYRSLLIARSYYFDSQDSLPEWKRHVVSTSRQRQGTTEPPIMEFVVSVGYRLIQGEHFWIAKLLSSIFWLIGGGFVYLIAKRIAGTGAALFSTAFYLFLPFAVVASRSFQPDPLMVMLLLASTFAIVRYHDDPSNSRLAIAAAVAASAFLIKPHCLFTIVGAFGGPAISKQGLQRAVMSRASLVFNAVVLLPGMLINLGGIFMDSRIVGEAQKTLLPQLWVSPFFWRSWLSNIGLTVGFIPFIGALLGTLLFREGLPRALMIGLWTGYLVFGLVFDYNLATHDYYQLQLIPIVALSIGPVVALVMNGLGQIRTELYWRIAAWSVLLIGLALSVGVAGSRLVNPDVERMVGTEREIGELVNHSTKTIFLSSAYGVPLEYHGLLSGSAWPLASDLEWERLAGVATPTAEERFNAWFSKVSPEYFIVEDLQEFEQQPDLKRFLSRFPIVSQNNDYLIFKLNGS